MSSGVSESNYGYVSGRVVSIFLEAAQELGVSESLLRSEPVSRGYAYYQNPQNSILWNDFIAFIECAQRVLQTPEELERLGHQCYLKMTDLPSARWAARVLTLKAAIRLSFTKRYNYYDLAVDYHLSDEELVLNYSLPKSADVFSESFFYLLKGSLLHSPELMGESAYRYVRLSLNAEQKSARVVCGMPPKKAWWRALLFRFGLAPCQRNPEAMLTEHITEVEHLRTQHQRDLSSLFGLLSEVVDPVMIISGERILYQNQSMRELMSVDGGSAWLQCFVQPDAVVALIESAQVGEECYVELKRGELPQIQVGVTLVSIQQGQASAEAILRLRDLKIPIHPGEIFELASERERKQLARNMHDSMGQLITATSFQIASLERTETDETRALALNQVSKMVREIAEYARSFTRDLDLLVEQCDSLYQAVELVEKECAMLDGVSLSNKIDATFVLEHPEAIKQLVLVIQEAVNNASRHGGATEVRLTSRFSQQSKMVLIEDNGGGMDAATASEGMGLRNMQHRVSSIGGKITFSQSALGGVQICCQFNP